MPTTETDVAIYRKVILRNPFSVETLPFLSHVHRAAFRKRRRISKRFIGKPMKRLFVLLQKLGFTGTGTVSIKLPTATRRVTFNARNTQFGALYMPASRPVYEPETSALLDLLVTDDSVFADVGANWGWYSFLIASRPGFQASVHAFEPFPETFKDLRSFSTQAGLEQRVVCHDVALADHDGETTMAFSDGIQSGLARLGESGGPTVRLSRLDSLAISSPDVIKIDAEDHELEVLQGASQTIEAARPFIVFENWLHRDKPSLTLDPFTFLAERKYRFFYPGWVSRRRDCVVSQLEADDTGAFTLAVVPFLPVQRFQMQPQMNVLAVPEERYAEMVRRLA